MPYLYEIFEPDKGESAAGQALLRMLACEDGEVVGRIAVIENKASNEKWGQKAARFGWVDFIDDALVVWCENLRSVVPICFVTIVFAWVVACCDVDSSLASEVTYCERHFW